MYGKVKKGVVAGTAESYPERPPEAVTCTSPPGCCKARGQSYDRCAAHLLPQRLIQPVSGADTNSSQFSVLPRCANSELQQKDGAAHKLGGAPEFPGGEQGSPRRRRRGVKTPLLVVARYRPFSTTC